MSMLVEQCRSPYVIWLNAAASVSETYAAEELCVHLRQMTGGYFPVVRSKDLPELCIVVGGSPALAGLGIDLSAEQLGDEGFILRTVGDRLVIAGGAKRGTLYGVYTFLEDVMGARWYAPGVTRLPKRPTLELPCLNVRKVPALEYREVFYSVTAGDGTWAARNKSNGHSASILPHQGGKVSYFPFVHSFESILSPKEHFDAHPEYFSMVDGLRIREHAQLCLTNEDVIRIAINTVKRWIAEHPEASIVSVSQNDWYNPCTCPACRAVDEREGSHAGTLIQFINRIAQAIAPEYPHITIDTLAYQYTRKPPRFIRPLPNVCVRLCSIECCFAHPLESCSEICSCAENTHGDSFQSDLAGWAKVCDRLYVWDYVVNFHHFLMPFPNFDVLAPNIRYFVRNHVKGLFEEGATSPYGRLEFAELRTWVLAKLMWEPELDTHELVADFMSGYFGAAAPRILAYFDLIHDALRILPDAHFGIFLPPRVQFLGDAEMVRAEALFDEAERVADDPQVLERVRVARLSVRYWNLLRMDPKTPGRDQAIEQFRLDVIARGMYQISEWYPLEFSIEKLKEGLTYRY